MIYVSYQIKINCLSPRDCLVQKGVGGFGVIGSTQAILCFFFLDGFVCS